MDAQDLALDIIELRCPDCGKQFRPNNFSISLLEKHGHVELAPMLSYLRTIEENHLVRDRKEEDKVKIPRKQRMEMYDNKSIALYKLSKEFQLPDQTLLSLFETCTIVHNPAGEKSHIEMWRLREYLYHGFYLTSKKVEPPKWVANVAESRGKYAHATTEH